MYSSPPKRATRAPRAPSTLADHPPDSPITYAPKRCPCVSLIFLDAVEGPSSSRPKGWAARRLPPRAPRSRILRGTSGRTRGPTVVYVEQPCDQCSSYFCSSSSWSSNRSHRFADAILSLAKGRSFRLAVHAACRSYCRDRRAPSRRRDLRVTRASTRHQRVGQHQVARWIAPHQQRAIDPFAHAHIAPRDDYQHRVMAP